MSRFSYFYEADTINFQLETAMAKLENCGSQLSQVAKCIGALADGLEDLQKNCNDQEPTNIAQDYKDCEACVGDNASGINGYAKDLDALLAEFSEYFMELDRITHS